ncbi:MAG: PrgI family protein [Patescibacteria group bacterium]
MQFQIPQFIEVEDKIFGPLTFKQFIYIAGACGAAFILWRALPIFLSGPAIVFVGAAGAALALFEWNNRPLILSLEASFYYLIGTKLYVWSHERKQQKAIEAAKKNELRAEVYVPHLSDSKLHDLAWSLDIKEKIERGGVRDLSRGAEALVARNESIPGLLTPRDALA